MSGKETANMVKGRSFFTLVGKVKISDNSFVIDKQCRNGWINSSLKIGVNTGNNNVVYATMSGGYFVESSDRRPYRISALQKKDENASEKTQRVEVAWEDRMNQDLLKSIADVSLITAELEKDVKGNIVSQKFLSAYDAVRYIKEHLTDGAVVKVKGKLKYEFFDGRFLVKKEITSIALSSASESEYQSKFIQSILVDDTPFCGKWEHDESEGVIKIGLDAHVVDYIKDVRIGECVYEIRKNVAIPMHYEFAINKANAANAQKIQNLFKTKPNRFSEMVVEGKFVDTIVTQAVSLEDIPKDIRDMISLGLLSEEQWTNRQVLSNSSKRERHMYIQTFAMVSKKTEDDTTVNDVSIEPNKYTSNDIYFFGQALTDAGYVDPDSYKDDNESLDTESEESGEVDDVLAMLNNLN